MAIIASLEAVIKARTKHFERGLKRARRKLERFAKGIARTGLRIAKFGAALGAVAVGALALYVRQSFKAIDATAKMADNLGLAVESLLAYQHAAQLAGLEQKDLETGLRRLSKNISDAQVGLTTAQRAFEDLGLSWDDLSKMTPEKALGLVGDRLSAMENVFTRARVAQDLFGRSGIKMIKFLQGGSKGLEEAKVRAQQLGISLSRVDASKIEMANDAITELKALFRGAANQIAVSLAPFVKFLSDRLVNLGTAGTGMAGVIQGAFKTVVEAMDGMRVFLVERLPQAFQHFKTVMFTGLADITEQWGKLITFMTTTELGSGKTKGPLQGFGGKTGGLLAKLGIDPEGLAKATDGFRAAAAEAARNTLALEGSADSQFFAKYFKTITDGATQAAGDVLLVRGALEGLNGAAAKIGRGAAKQVDLRNRSISGLAGAGGRQDVQDKKAHALQLKGNDLLMALTSGLQGIATARP